MSLKDCLLSRPKLAKAIGVSLPTLDFALKGQYSEKTKKLIIAFVKAQITALENLLFSLTWDVWKN